MAEAPPIPGPPHGFDAPLGRKIIALHVWAVEQGLRGTEAEPLFDGFCQRLVLAGVPLWRGFAVMRTLHPPPTQGVQWFLVITSSLPSNNPANCGAAI